MARGISKKYQWHFDIMSRKNHQALKEVGQGLNEVLAPAKLKTQRQKAQLELASMSPDNPSAPTKKAELTKLKAQESVLKENKKGRPNV